MKSTGSVATATAAASVTAAVSSLVSKFGSHHEDDFARKLGDASASNTRASNSEKYAPKFDGLRFIETLVTAHR
ncbi:hypothetical protein M569_09747 [Genlisea aurea]|uniref:Uncharacterized protein n=1 Tax=Genlisea aurea TaxID=192259 RepID=S8DPN1_9LAMI|nr:hypothetical protein M569_09747 [Genlisea aurea]